MIFDLLVIHYLQKTTPPVLPVLHEMCDNDDEIEDGLIKTDIDKLLLVSGNWSTDNLLSVGQLFHGLLRLV